MAQEERTLVPGAYEHIEYNSKCLKIINFQFDSSVPTVEMKAELHSEEFLLTVLPISVQAVYPLSLTVEGNLVLPHPGIHVVATLSLCRVHKQFSLVNALGTGIISAIPLDKYSEMDFKVVAQAKLGYLRLWGLNYPAACKCQLPFLLIC